MTIENRIKIAELLPKGSHPDFANYNKCYLGVSIKNPLYKSDELEIVLDWIDQHFDECAILIGDHLHRITEMIIQGSSETSAIATAEILGDTIQKNFERLIGERKEKFRIIRWDTFQRDPACLKRAIEYRQLYNDDPVFKTSVWQTAKDFIDRRMKKNDTITVTYEEAVNYSTQYILEELAVFSIMIDRGYNIQIYPGSQLNVLKQIVKKDCEECRLNLNEGFFISITLKP